MKTTKQLARELGLLRKRSKSTVDQNLKRIRKTCQIFSYLIVLDYESTCWQEKYRTQEIIEFPAVLLNTSTGEIESEFHHYVQPQEHPVLSDFCKELTGISQEQVDEGIPLSSCLRKFSSWLGGLREKKGLVYNDLSQPTLNTCTFVTWSDWDLGVCLQYECRRKQLRKPNELTSWIDLRATYRNFYSRKPKGLEGALQDLGINFEGRQHSGLDDAKNTARLCWRMMCDGCVMKITKSLQSSGPNIQTRGFLQIRPPQGKSNTTSITLPSNGKAPTNTVNGPQTSVARQENIASETVTPPAISDSLSTTSGFAVTSNKTSSLSSKGTAPSTCMILKAPMGILMKPSAQSVQKDSNSKTDQPKPGSCKTEKENKVLKADEMHGSFDKVSAVRCPKPVSNPHFGGSNKGCVSETNCHPNQVGSVPSQAASLPGKGSSLFKRPFQRWTSSNSGDKDGSSKTSPKTCGMNSKDSGSVFKVPTPPPASGGCLSGSFKTPPTTNFSISGNNSWQATGQNTHLAKLKKTPPLCECGRRSHRKFVQSPGPNMGRAFYCCPKGKRQSKNNGCKFFKWENPSPGSGGRSHNHSRTSSNGSLFDISNTSSNSSLSSSFVSQNIISPSNDNQASVRQFPIPQPNFNTPSVELSNTGSSVQKKTLGTRLSVIINPFKK